MKKRSNLRYFALFLLLSGIFLITSGILYIRSDMQKEEIDNANNIDIKEDENVVYFNKNVYFKIEDSTLKYVNEVSAVQLGKSFPYGVAKISATRTCSDNSMFNLYVLNKKGKVFINKYPSFKIDSSINYEMDFIEVKSDRKVKDMRVIPSNNCNEGGIKFTLDNNKSVTITIKNSKDKYTDNNYIIESAEITQE